MFRLFEKVKKGEVYVIAEMSANHGGNLENALEIVKQASNAGADCLKIQTYTADSMTIDCDNEPFHVIGGLWDGYKLYDLYREASTPYEWQKEIKKECERCGIDFLSTPFDRNAVDFLESVGAEAYKIASFELVDIPLIEYVASKGKPMIISCGMGSIQEINDAVSACRKQGNNQIVLLKCCSEYPANWDDMHLGNIADMRKRFGTWVGLSDHSFGSISAIVGVTLGACVVEKHIKIDGVKSADSEFSMTIEEFASMVDDIKVAKKIAQGPTYELSEKEKDSKVFRRSIFAVKEIEAGDIFTESNIRVIRPSDGIPPKYYNEMIGTCSARKIKRGEPIRLEDIRGKKFDELADEYELRDVEAEDMNLLFTWANDPAVRKNAFRTEQIPFEDHKKWFDKLLSDSSQKQYIFMRNGQPIGQIRFSVSDDEAKIDYSISSDKRGCGYGKIMMNLAKRKFHEEYPGVRRLIGQIKPGNPATRRCFEKCEFEQIFCQFEYDFKE